MIDWWMLTVCVGLVILGVCAISLTGLGLVLLIERIKDKIIEKRNKK